MTDGMETETETNRGRKRERVWGGSKRKKGDGCIFVGVTRGLPNFKADPKTFRLAQSA